MPQTYAGQRITAGLLASDYCAADTNTNVVTSSTDSNLSTIYTIPAGDPQAGTAYRLTTSGNGTWGSSAAQGITFQPNLAGTLTAQVMIGANAFNASQAIRWKAILIATCQAPGSAGTWYLSLEVVLSNYNTSLLWNNINNATLAGCGANSTAVVADTVDAAMNFELDAAWGSTTGAPTITAHSTLFEKLGG